MIIDVDSEAPENFYRIKPQKDSVFHGIEIKHEELPFGLLDSELVQQIFEINQIRRILSAIPGSPYKSRPATSRCSSSTFR